MACRSKSPEKRRACQPGADPWGCYRGPPGGGAARWEGLGARGTLVDSLRFRGAGSAPDQFGSGRGGWRALPAVVAWGREVSRCGWALAPATSERGCPFALHGSQFPAALSALGVENAWTSAAAVVPNAAGHPGVAQGGSGSRSWAAGVVERDPPQGGARPCSGQKVGGEMSRHFYAAGAPAQYACRGLEPPLRLVCVLRARPEALRHKAAGWRPPGVSGLSQEAGFRDGPRALRLRGSP